MKSTLALDGNFQVDDISTAVASLKDSQGNQIVTSLSAEQIQGAGYIAKFKTTQHYLKPLRIELAAPTQKELTAKGITATNDLTGLFLQIDSRYDLNSLLSK